MTPEATLNAAADVLRSDPHRAARATADLLAEVADDMGIRIAVWRRTLLDGDIPRLVEAHYGRHLAIARAVLEGMES